MSGSKAARDAAAQYSAMHQLRLFCGTISITIFAAACSATDSCPNAQPVRIIDTGTTDTNELLYESAPWNGPLEPFPAMSELIFKHHLGVTPQIMQTHVSFSQNGTDGSGLAENAGDTGEMTCVDSQVIRVRNNTCENHLFIRVVAMATRSASTELKCSAE
ncbi:MAG: hypothetical protein ACOY0T_07715 [Myxococcota bacterium]